MRCMAYSYKVVEVREKLMGGKMSGEKLEKLLNEHAAQGWQLKAIHLCQVKGRVGPGGVEGLLVTFERATACYTRDQRPPGHRHHLQQHVAARRTDLGCRVNTLRTAETLVGDTGFHCVRRRPSKTPQPSVDGKPRTYTLRATQVYRREGGEWRVAHRHGDTVTLTDDARSSARVRTQRL